MLIPLFGRFGWSDEVGPLWFLRERWRCGPRWRPRWARFFAGPTGITMQALAKDGGFAYAGFFVPAELWSDLSYGQKEDVVMSWIREVRRTDGPNGSGGSATDPEWMSHFPALHDYLAVGTHADGSARRTSTLTLFAEHGSWKCYLNERDAGASLCASGLTIAGALSALEVMLEDERTPWRFSDPPRPAGRKSAKKDS